MNIDQAIARHGAVVVYRAAVRWMEGDRAVAQSLGLDIANAAAAYQAMRIAYTQLTPAEQAADLADATIKAAKIGTH